MSEVDTTQEGTLSPEEVLAEKERLLNERETELKRRESILQMQPDERVKSAATAADEAAVQARKDAGYYCPGCGKASKYPKECVGTPTAPHPAIEVVESAELDGDPSGHSEPVYVS